MQSQPFADMTEDSEISEWLNDFSLWDAENEEEIRLNAVQKHDLNLMPAKALRTSPVGARFG